MVGAFLPHILLPLHDRGQPHPPCAVGGPGHTHAPSMFIATIHRVSLFILSFKVHTRSPITKIFKIKVFIFTMLDVMPFMCIVYREWKCDISNPNG